MSPCSAFSRKLAQRIHARRRAEERYGLVVTNKLLREVARAIQTGGARFIRSDPHPDRTHWVVELTIDTLDSHCEMSCRVVYDSRTREVVTFLPSFRDRGEAAP